MTDSLPPETEWATDSHAPRQPVTSPVPCSVVSAGRRRMAVAYHARERNGMLHAFASRVNDHGLNIVAGCAGRFNDQAWGQFELAGTPTKLAEFKNFLEKEKTLTAEGWKPDPAVVRDLFFRIPDRVGLLNDITAACAEAGFGIGHLYCTLEVEVPSGKEWARMYVQLEVPSDRRHLLPTVQVKLRELAKEDEGGQFSPSLKEHVEKDAWRFPHWPLDL